MKHIFYYTNEGTVLHEPSVYAESDYKTLVANLETLAKKFRTMDGFTVEFSEGTSDYVSYEGSVCERYCYLKVAQNGIYFLNNQIQLMND